MRTERAVVILVDSPTPAGLGLARHLLEVDALVVEHRPAETVIPVSVSAADVRTAILCLPCFERESYREPAWRGMAREPWRGRKPR